MNGLLARASRSRHPITIRYFDEIEVPVLYDPNILKLIDVINFDEIDHLLAIPFLVRALDRYVPFTSKRKTMNVRMQHFEGAFTTEEVMETLRYVMGEEPIGFVESFSLVRTAVQKGALKPGHPIVVLEPLTLPSIQPLFARFSVEFRGIPPGHTVLRRLDFISPDRWPSGTVFPTKFLR